MQEINDLKNIVIQSLESKGILSQLRAQIRSSVFKIIEDQESKDAKNPAFFWENPLCQKIHDTEEGLLSIELMHEFFEFFRMDYTNNVFIHESNYKESFTRDMVKKKLHVSDNKNEQPLLLLIIKQLLGGMFTGSQVQEGGAETNDRLKITAANDQSANMGKSGLTNSGADDNKSSTDEAGDPQLQLQLKESLLREEAEKNQREQEIAHEREVQREMELQAQREAKSQEQREIKAQREAMAHAQAQAEFLEQQQLAAERERVQAEKAKKQQQHELEKQMKMEALQKKQQEELEAHEASMKSEREQSKPERDQTIPNDSGTQNLSQNKSERDPVSATGGDSSKVDLENFIEHGNLENQLYDSDLHNQNDDEIVNDSDMMQNDPSRRPEMPDKEGPNEDMEDGEEYGEDWDEEEIPNDIEEDLLGDGQDEYDPRQPMYEDDDNGQLVSSDEMYMSESLGVNFSVNSLALEEFDYVEDVEAPDEMDMDYEEGVDGEMEE
jgi:flagellar biosynthesis GTPase FlhF